MIVKIHGSLVVNAIGEVTHGCRKPVICLTDGAIYASAKDTAKANGVSVHTISNVCLGKIKSCKGKQFRYLEDMAEYFDVLMDNFRRQVVKANAYDLQEAAKAAEAERKANIIKLEEQIANEERRTAEKRNRLMMLKGEQITVAI